MAYDLARTVQVDEILLADSDLDVASTACDRVNQRIERTACRPCIVDATDHMGLADVLSGYDVAIAAAPYRLNPNVHFAGLSASCPVVDMGLDTPDAHEVHKLSDEARSKGVSLVTDCGVAPGLVNIVASHLVSRVPGALAVKLYCGGLPETPQPPFFHQVGFSVDSLLGEYVDPVESLVDGQVQETDPLEQIEVLEFEGLGKLEAATTSGGTGTAAYFWRGQLDSYVYKTLRFPGHWRTMTLLRDAGFWSEEPDSNGCVPRDMTLEIMSQHMVVGDYRDIVVALVKVESATNSASCTLVDRYDPATGWTAMQRTTGFSTAIVAQAVLEGMVTPGAGACESMVDSQWFIEQLVRRNLMCNFSGLA